MKKMISKLSKIQRMGVALLVAGSMVACSEKDLPDPQPQEPEYTPEELAEMAAVDKFAAANSVYRALGLLNELPDNWEGVTYTPEVGVPVDEANTDVRNVISTGADHAKGYFLSIVPDEGLSGDTWSHEGVGTLTYRTVNEENCYAVIDVNLVQMPGLKQLRFVPEEVVGENSFSGTPYYCAGDIVKDKKGIIWICVRPSGGPLKKDNAYFVSFDKSLIKTVKQKQDIYKSYQGKLTKEKLAPKSGEWTYAKNLVEERIALATAHTFAMMFGGVRTMKKEVFVDYLMALEYYGLFNDSRMMEYIDVRYLIANRKDEVPWNNENTFAVAYGSHVKNKTTKLRQEKYLQPFLFLMHNGALSGDGTKMSEIVIKCWDDPKTSELSSMPYSLTTDYDPLSFEYFSGRPMTYYTEPQYNWDDDDYGYYAPSTRNGVEGDFRGELGLTGMFDIMNYAIDIKLGEQLPKWYKYSHMKGCYNDLVLVLTQTYVKDNGKAHKDFVEEICKSENYRFREPAYWASLEKTERLVLADGNVTVEKNIYE